MSLASSSLKGVSKRPTWQKTIGDYDDFKGVPIKIKKSDNKIYPLSVLFLLVLSS